MNALFDVSDRYAVVLVTYISQLTTVFFGIKEFHEGTAMEFHEGTAMKRLNCYRPCKEYANKLQDWRQAARSHDKL